MLAASVRLDSSNAESLYALALLHLRVGNNARAVLELKQAIEQRPGDARFHYHLGVAYNNQDAADQAILALEEAARLRPDDARVHRLLGVAYDKKELPVRAREAYRRAAALNG
jgi:Flp pilus assembly protein TadD